jgi:hypothetical protein
MDDAASPTVRTALRRTALAPEWFALAAVAAWFALVRNGPLINDTAWQLWIGAHLNGGARLYVDILEVNPPLWFWIGAAVERMAAATALPGLAILAGLFALVAAAAVLLIGAILRCPRDRLAYELALVATLALTSSFALGQREQFAFITALPYVALIARRAEGRPLSARLAFAVGLFAAAGFALKHYFALVPLGLEAWLFLRRREFTLHPEWLALLLAASAYLVAMALLTPAYFTNMLPILRIAYGGFGGQPLLLQPAIAVMLLTLLAVRPIRDRLSPASISAGIAAIAFLFAYLLQRKGFDYQAIPALGCTLACLFAAFAGVERRPRAPTALAGAGALLVTLALPSLAGPSRFDGAARAATADLPDGASLLVLTSSGTTAWPLVEQRHFAWPSRHMTLWMLGPVWLARTHGDTSPALERLGRQIVTETAIAIRCDRPRMILVDRRYDALAGRGGVLGYFRRDPAFAEALATGYSAKPDVAYLQVFQPNDLAAVASPRARTSRACDSPPSPLPRRGKQ